MPNVKQESIGGRLKRLRLARGMSQRDLSSKGVSYAYISRIEAGARTPSVKALRKLAEKLGVSVEYLETGRPDEIEEALAQVGLSRNDLKPAELDLVLQVASAWRRIGAYDAALRVLDERDRDLMGGLADALEKVRERHARGVLSGSR